MVKQPSYYRARLSAFKHFIAHDSNSSDKGNPVCLLKYGVIHPEITQQFETHLSKTFADYTFSELPLTFTELCSFNTWFALHPEKIAGKEFITTSREFPVGIKGTKEEVIRVVGGADSKGKTPNNGNNRIRIAKAKALAKIKLLKLIK